MNSVILRIIAENFVNLNAIEQTQECNLASMVWNLHTIEHAVKGTTSHRWRGVSEFWNFYAGLRGTFP